MEGKSQCQDLPLGPRGLLTCLQNRSQLYSSQQLSSAAAHHKDCDTWRQRFTAHTNCNQQVVSNLWRNSSAFSGHLIMLLVFKQLDCYETPLVIVIRAPAHLSPADLSIFCSIECLHTHVFTAVVVPTQECPCLLCHVLNQNGMHRRPCLSEKLISSNADD